MAKESPHLAIEIGEDPTTTKFLNASREGKLTEIKDLIEKSHININIQGNDKSTALSLACANGHEDVVDYLLSVPKEGRVPKFFASIVKYIPPLKKRFFKRIYEVKIDLSIDTTNNNQITKNALTEAAEKNRANIVKKLVNSGAKIPLIALTSAAKNDNFALYKFLYNNFTPDNNLPTLNNYDTIRIYTFKGLKDNENSVKFAKLLYHHPEYKNIMLYRAAQSGLTNICDFLIDKKNSEVNWYYDFTPHPYSTINGTIRTRSKKGLEYLIKRGALKEYEKPGFKPPLAEAVSSNWQGGVNCLIRHGVNINYLDLHGNTALDYAIEKDNLNMVKLLVKNGATITKAITGNSEIIKVLASRDINKGEGLANKDELSNLMIIAQDPNPEQLEALRNLVERKPEWVINRLTDKEIQKYIDKNIIVPTEALIKLAKDKGRAGIAELLSEKMRQLAEDQSNIMAKSKEGKSKYIALKSDDEYEFLKAAETGNLDEIKRQLEKGININIQDEENSTALSLACANGHEKIVDHLLSVQKTGETPRFFASIVKHIPSLKKMFFNRIYAIDLDLNVANTNDNKIEENALLKAVDMSQIEIVKKLVNSGAKVTSAALYSAAKNGNFNLYKILYDNLKTKDRLILMANTFDYLEDNEESVQFAKLLYNTLGNKNTFLRCAVQNGLLRICDFLIEKGAKIGVVDSECTLDGKKHLPLNDTIMKKKSIAGLEYLIKKGALNNYDFYDQFKTALAEAVCSNWQEAVQCLIKHGANINYKDFYFNTALDYAIETNNLDMVKLLIENGATITSGKTTNIEIIKLLDSKEIKPGTRYVVHNSTPEQFEILLDNNLIKDSEAIKIAYDNEQYDILKIIAEERPEWVIDKLEANDILKCIKEGYFEPTDRLIKLAREKEKANIAELLSTKMLELHKPYRSDFGGFQVKAEKKALTKS